MVALQAEGGKVGPELNYPMNVTEYYKPIFLKKWINNPSSIRSHTPMPKFPDNIQNKDKIIDDIVAYLQSMVGKKIKAP